MKPKDTNPKDAIAGTRLPMDLVPSSIPVLAALGYLEGALKYGKYNWRIAGVRFSVYLAAIRRHLEKLQNGEWEDPKTRVPHLASIICGCGIIADAKLCGKLTDDRPLKAPYGDYIDAQTVAVLHLKQLFKDYNPRQYTIHDSQQEAQSADPEAAGAQARPRLRAKRKSVRAQRGRARRRSA